MSYYCVIKTDWVTAFFLKAKLGWANFFAQHCRMPTRGHFLTLCILCKSFVNNSISMARLWCCLFCLVRKMLLIINSKSNLFMAWPRYIQNQSYGILNAISHPKFKKQSLYGIGLDISNIDRMEFWMRLGIQFSNHLTSATSFCQHEA